MLRTKIKVFSILVFATGIVLLLFGVSYSERDAVVVSVKATDQHEIQYDAKVRSLFSTEIRLCGGQMDWCGQNGCYRVITPLPITIEPRQEVTITVSISPRDENLAETELILYADGQGLNGLTSVKIKLPAVSPKSP